MKQPTGWIGVDLDGTLAVYDHWRGPLHIGEPIPAMLQRVKEWIAAGREVRIFTARAYGAGPEHANVIRAIRQWCIKHVGEILEITNEKDFYMESLYDDRARQVVENTGEIVGDHKWCERLPEVGKTPMDMFLQRLIALCAEYDAEIWAEHEGGGRRYLDIAVGEQTHEINGWIGADSKV